MSHYIGVQQGRVFPLPWFWSVMLFTNRWHLSQQIDFFHSSCTVLLINSLLRSGQTESGWCSFTCCYTENALCCQFGSLEGQFSWPTSCDFNKYILHLWRAKCSPELDVDNFGFATCVCIWGKLQNTVMMSFQCFPLDYIRQWWVEIMENTKCRTK